MGSSTDWTKLKIDSVNDASIETSKIEKQRKKKQNKIPQNCRITKRKKKSVPYTQ